jgi:hypothetical protein
MNLVDTITKLTNRIKEASAGVAGDIAALREQIATKRAGLRHAQDAFVPRDEILAHRPAAVKAIGEHWNAQNGHNVAVALGHPRNPPRSPWGFTEPVPWGALCAGDPDLAMKILAAAAVAYEYEPGPPSSEREGIIEQMARELVALEQHEESAIDAATAAGVPLAHRPDVIQRRETERRRAELENQAVPDREAREAALNQGAHRRPAPNPYLAPGPTTSYPDGPPPKVPE